MIDDFPFDPDYPDPRVVPLRPDPDNADPWAAGYAAGLRASGSTFISDDNVDPRVVVVRMLPEEFEEQPIARATLIELSRRIRAATARMDTLDDRRSALRSLAVRISSLARRMDALEDQAAVKAASGPMRAGDNIPPPEWRE